MPDLVTPFVFVLEIDSVEIATFGRCSGIESETEVVEYKEGGDPLLVRKIPGATKWSDLTLERRIDGSATLWEWRRQVVEGDIHAARRNGSIVVKDSQQVEVARWNFVNGWPSKVTGPSLNASGNEIAVEEVTIVHEGLERAS